MSNVDFLEWLLQEDSFEQFIAKAGANPDKYNDLKQLDIEKAKIKVFGMYIEGLNASDGARLIRLIQKARSQGKFVAIYKTGRTKQGAHAAAGHTASLSGSYDMFKQLLSTSGAVLCETLEEFEDTVYLATAFSNKQVDWRKVFKVGVLTNAGFEKCCYADHLFLKNDATNYLGLPSFEQEKGALTQIFDKYKLSAVIDLDQILDTTPTLPDLGYYEFAKILVDSPDISAVIVSPVPETHMMASVTGDIGKLCGRDYLVEEEAKSFPKLMKKLAGETQKPLIMTIECGWKFVPLRQYFLDAGVVVFERSDRAARALSNVCRGFVGWTGPQ